MVYQDTPGVTIEQALYTLAHYAVRFHNRLGRDQLIGPNHRDKNDYAAQVDSFARQYHRGLFAVHLKKAFIDQFRKLKLNLKMPNYQPPAVQC